MNISELPAQNQDALKEYFNNPYPGYVYIYNNTLILKELETHTFHDLLNHNLTVDGKTSISLSIVSAIDTKLGGIYNKTILDVGCKIGHFSQLLAERGAYVIGVESLKLPCRVAEALVLLRKQTKVRIINSTIQEYFPKATAKLDLALMLNVFDHILRQNEDEAWNLLYNISEKSKYLALMMGSFDESIDADIPSKILSHTIYRYADKILKNSYGGRNLWMFTR